MSLMPRLIVDELRLERHGYKVYPMGPGYYAFPDGRSLVMTGGVDARRDYETMARFSRRDAEAYPEWRRWLGELAAILEPLLLTTPPRLGSRRPGDLVEQLKLAWRMRGLDVRRVGELTRLMTMSAWDLLDDWFESPQIKGALAVDGVIGTWAGPASPGTAYVLMHHEIGDAGLGLGSWGYPRGGMGAVSDALRSSAEEFGAEVRTEAPVERILQRDGRVVGVVLGSGEELRADCVVAATHPRITFLEQLRREELPDDFVRSIERWNSRSGVVKLNLALAALPEFNADPGAGEHLGGAIELAHSIDYIEEAFQDARRGEAARRPFSDGVIPTVFDRTLCPEGYHVMSLFTQWVPHGWSEEPHREELEAYADRVIDGYTELAPNLKGAILHRQVLGPYDMEQEIGLIGGNIFHGELTAEQLFHMRPAPGYADYRTPIHGLYQASSATHAGGGVCAIPAYNCVRQIRRDRRRERLKECLRVRGPG
jgi:phytoene dehydrogenase-like protein